MAPVKINSEKTDFEKSTVYTVPYFKTDIQETLTRRSDLKMKICGAVFIITALLVGGFLTTVYLTSSPVVKEDEKSTSNNVKNFEAVFEVDGKDTKEEVRIDRFSEIAVFDDVTDGFTVVLDYKRSLAVFKNLKNNTCYFTNLEDIPIQNVLDQEDEESMTIFVPNDKDEDRQGTSLTITSTSELPGKYVAKTNNVVVSKMCARGTSFWGYITEDAATEGSSRQKRFPSRCSGTCLWNCCFYLPYVNTWSCCYPIRIIVNPEPIMRPFWPGWEW